MVGQARRPAACLAFPSLWLRIHVSSNACNILHESIAQRTSVSAINTDTLFLWLICHSAAALQHR